MNKYGSFHEIAQKVVDLFEDWAKSQQTDDVISVELLIQPPFSDEDPWVTHHIHLRSPHASWAKDFMRETIRSSSKRDELKTITDEEWGQILDAPINKRQRRSLSIIRISGGAIPGLMFDVENVREDTYRINSILKKAGVPFRLNFLPYSYDLQDGMVSIERL